MNFIGDVPKNLNTEKTSASTYGSSQISRDLHIVQVYFEDTVTKMRD